MVRGSRFGLDRGGVVGARRLRFDWESLRWPTGPTRRVAKRAYRRFCCAPRVWVDDKRTPAHPRH